MKKLNLKILLHFFQSKILWIAGLITSGQIFLACLLAPHSGFPAGYRDLCIWDCGWYSSIAADGYHSTIPPVPQNGALANVAFFPGYPYLARILYRGLHIEPRLALLLIADLACFLFWVVFLALLRHWGVGRYASMLSVLAVLAHPASFMLVVGYSESLFLASFLAFIYFSYQNTRKSTFLSSGFGFLMTATRIVGIPFVVFPIIQNFDMKRAFLISLLSVMGAGSFFLYCGIQFGKFDLYMATQKVGWGIVPHYLAFFDFYHLKAWYPWDAWATRLSYWAILIFFVLECVLKRCMKDSQLRGRLPFYFCSLSALFVSVSGLSERGMMSVIRYSLVWYILSVFCVVRLSMLMRPLPDRLNILILLVVGSFLFGIFFQVQVPCQIDFLRGYWFA